MNRFSLTALLFTFFSCAVWGQENSGPQDTPATNPSQTEWKISGANIAATAKKKAKPGGVSLAVKPNFKVTVVGKQPNLKISFSDGKIKFGQTVFRIQNGENVYLRPRLSLTVPLKKAMAVTGDTPLKVLEFFHMNDKFELNLVANSSSNFPDVVITKKK